MKCIVNASVKKGCSMKEQSKRVSIREAEKILTSPEQRYYTRALRDGTNAELFINYITCPFCEKQFAVNTKFSAIGNFRYESLPEEKVHQWSSPQESFLKTEKDRELRISFPIKKPESFVCSGCGKTSMFSDEVKVVSLSLERMKIRIRTEITDMGEMLSFKWQGNESLSLTFPMYEVLTFNLGKGRTDIRLEDSAGNLLCRRDVTGNPQMLEGSICSEVLWNKKIKETAKKLFTMAWGRNLPCESEDITMEKLFKMTEFVGYDEEFYDTIPYELETEMIEHTFKKRAKAMHNSRDIVDMYKKSGMPDVKSVKRLFYETPGLCFYIEEAETMWNIIKDYNVFCRFISDTNAFRILSDIHIRPKITEFIKDYCTYRGSSRFVKKAIYSWDDVLNEAIDYCCASESVKEKIRDSWFKKGSIGRIVTKKPLFSLPITKPYEKIKDCVIDGYEFFWLRTVNEFINAGKQLNNCLSSWGCDDSPVVCVKKGDRYVAAIEVCEGMVSQAYEHSNTTFGTDTKLSAAFDKWFKTFELQWFPIDDDLDIGF